MRRAIVRPLAAILFCLLAAPPAAQGADWRVVEVAAPGRVDEVVAADRSAAIRFGRAWHRATACASGICLAPASPPRRQRPPAGGLPDGWVSHGSGPGIAVAWYGEPTGRYDHAILGDAIEAGALHVRDAAGTLYRLRLPDDQVFEDLAPRIADIDGDGRNDIVAIRSFLDRGASLAVCGLDAGRLRLKASTAPIGKAHRWLNVAGIADFDGDGRNDIALVVTPISAARWNSGRGARTAWPEPPQRPAFPITRSVRGRRACPRSPTSTATAGPIWRCPMPAAAP